MGFCTDFRVLGPFSLGQVKAVREVMNQMLEAWKQIPDFSDEASPPPRSDSSSKGINPPPFPLVSI